MEDLKNLQMGKNILQQRDSQSYQQGGINVKSQIKNQRSDILQQVSHKTFNNASYGNIGMRAARRSFEISASAALSNGETESDQGQINDETSSITSDKYERDVTVLNHCFDDIEKFIARLQHAAAATRELERRRHNRKSKKKDLGEGLLSLRTRPPHEKEFIDIFSKFKLSFNLLAKLKAHIHDPNAPELVHFLFTPLALIVEASSDTYYDAQLPTRVINPLLTREAVNLLINCVTSKETELWRSLGDTWTIPRDQWKDNIGSYHPVFLDGWSPDYVVVDEIESPSTPTNISKRRTYTQGINSQANFPNTSGNLNTAESNFDEYDDKYNNVVDTPLSAQKQDNRTDFGTQSEISIDSIERNIVSIGEVSKNEGIHCMQNIHNSDAYGSSHYSSNDTRNIFNKNEDQILDIWLEKLQSTGANIVVVTYPRTANNDKELSVVRGEYLEVCKYIKKVI